MPFCLLLSLARLCNTVINGVLLLLDNTDRQQCCISGSRDDLLETALSLAI